MNSQNYVGTVTPASWDDRGQATSFSIFTSQGEDILLDCSKEVKNLKKLSGKKVKVKGEVKKSDFYGEILKPKHIHKISNHKKLEKSYDNDDVLDFPIHLPDLSPLQLLADDYSITA